MIVILTPDDPRRGTFAPDGTITRWPEQDAFGRSYAREQASVQWVDPQTFIVIPPGRAEQIEAVQVEDAAPAATPAADAAPAAKLKVGRGAAGEGATNADVS